MTRRPDSRRRVLEGLGAGAALGLADALAAGPWRTPPVLLAIGMAGFLLAGLASGVVGALLGRRGLALGLVLGGGTALTAVSHVLNDLGANPWAVAGAALLAPAVAAAATRLMRDGAVVFVGLPAAGVPASPLVFGAAGGLGAARGAGPAATARALRRASACAPARGRGRP